MIEILIISMVILSIFVNRRERLDCLIFSSMNAIFLTIGGLIEHPIYYFAAAIFDMFIAILLYIAWPYNKSRFVLMVLCGISVGLNFFGWALYENGSEPDQYDQLFELYYIIALVIIATRMRHGDRRWGRRIRSDHVDLHKTNMQGKK